MVACKRDGIYSQAFQRMQMLGGGGRCWNIVLALDSSKRMGYFQMTDGEIGLPNTGGQAAKPMVWIWCVEYQIAH